MGHTLQKPGAQFTALLVMGQLQSQSHSPLPSGQSHLQEHCMPSPPAGGAPDPDPVIGTGPIPDPVIGIGGSSDPDPVIGTGVSPDPDPVVGGAVVAVLQEHFEILPFPFLTTSVNEHPPISTSPDPEHFLSHFAVPLHFSATSRLKSHRHFFFPSCIFSFVKSSACTVAASTIARSDIPRNLMVKEALCDFPM